jgi:hypothetical protein
MDTPISLIEPGVRSFLKISLQNCKQLKEQYYNAIFNTAAFATFIAVVGIILVVKYKFKPSEEERERKLQEQREYVLSKLKLVNAKNFLASKNYSLVGGGDANNNNNNININNNNGNSGNIGNGSITNLPLWNTTATGHYELFAQNQLEQRRDEEYFMRMQL